MANVFKSLLKFTYVNTFDRAKVYDKFVDDNFFMNKIKQVRRKKERK